MSLSKFYFRNCVTLFLWTWIVKFFTFYSIFWLKVRFSILAYFLSIFWVNFLFPKTPLYFLINFSFNFRFYHFNFDLLLNIWFWKIDDFRWVILIIDFLLRNGCFQIWCAIEIKIIRKGNQWCELWMVMLLNIKKFCFGPRARGNWLYCP